MQWLYEYHQESVDEPFGRFGLAITKELETIRVES